MESEIIHIDHLSFTYPRMGQPILCDITLSVREGELLLITGANGSGKTTLGKCINGLIPYSTGGLFEGRVNVCGVDTLERSVSEIALQVGFVFSNPEDQLATPRVETEVAFGLSNLGVPREEIRERVDAILDRLAIEPLKESSTFNLSTGQQQMVAIASSLVMDPEVLILDDPLAHLNQNTIGKVVEVIRDLKEKGTTIIWISQETSELFEWADRIVVLDGGSVVFEGSPRSMVDTMGSRDLAVTVPQYLECSHALVDAGFPRALIETSLEQTIEKIQASIPSSPPRPMTDREEPVRSRDLGKGHALVRFDHVTFSYPDGFAALKDIGLELYPGDFVLLSGWNGSGKTTLTKHINGLLRPSAGAVYLDGENIARKPTSDLARDVGFLFQNPDHQLHKPTVRDELMFSLRNFGVADREIQERVREVSERFGLGRLLERSPQELSGSEKKKVTVASVVIYHPRILILDEATANLDRREATNLIEIIESYFDQNRIIISISHNIRMWADSSLLNRVIVMKDSAILEDGKPEEIFGDRGTMGYLYGSLLPVTEIALSLRDRGIEPSHYRTRTLVAQMEGLWRGSRDAPAQ